MAPEGGPGRTNVGSRDADVVQEEAPVVPDGEREAGLRTGEDGAGREAAEAVEGQRGGDRVTEDEVGDGGFGHDGAGEGAVAGDEEGEVGTEEEVGRGHVD